MAGSGFVLGNVSHSFGTLQVLEDVTIEVAAGEFIAIVGPSGCGKTTLLRALAGLLVPDAGSVKINNVTVAGRPGSLAYLPQKDSLLPWRRALENAMVGVTIAMRDDELARTKATALFDRFGLAGFEQAWPHELSGGMRQRVAVLRTFLLPHLALGLDEPFGALDALTRRTMQKWLREVWTEDRRSTLLITHDVEEALLLADRVLVMSARPGKVVASIDVKLDDDRFHGIETTEPFVALKREVLHALSV